MAGSGVCCESLEEPKALMKMGLSVLLVGHVNFLLAALVHGVVLRHINLHKQARAMEYAISNVIALTSGLVGVVVGILAIILSKNKRRRALTWALFAISLAAALMAAASAIGLFVSVVRAIMHGGRSLLTHCRFPDAIGYSSVTNECPFDPTRIYSTTLILWVPLIVTCVIQLVYSSRCAAACASFLGLPCCPARSRAPAYGKPVDVERPRVHAPPPRHTRHQRGYDEAPQRRAEHHRSHDERPARHAELPRSHGQPPRHATAPPRRQRRTPPPPQQPQHLPRQHHRRASPERQPLRQPNRERSSRERQETRPGSHQRPPEQHRLLQRGAMERSSFWI